MSRITAPATRLSKTLGTASAVAPAFRAGATIAPKYADLLRNIRPRDPSETRTLSTTQNPLRRPVSVTPSQPSNAPVDAAILPNLFASTSSVDAVRVPILPDAFGVAYASSSAAIPVAGTTVVAADPANVEPSSILTTVSHMGGVDNVEVGGVLKNIWNGLMEGLQPQTRPSAN